MLCPSGLAELKKCSFKK